MDYDEVVAYLDRHTNLGVKPGLERIEWLMDAMGRPNRCAPAIHVTGTNGKTTTARLISRICQFGGVRVGTYTSPHLERVNERISIDCESVSDDAFVVAFEDVLPFLTIMEDQLGDTATYFEIVTAMGFAAFAEAPVSTQVLEVGMGGRWDASNIADAEIAVITNVSLDHTEYLGAGVDEIAREKGGIIKPDAAVVLGWMPNSAAEVLALAASRAGAARVLRAGADFELRDRAVAHGGQVFSMSGVCGEYEDIYLPLYGKHQVLNAIIAIASAEVAIDGSLDEDLVRDAMAAATSPGRIEVVRRSPLVVLDGAHNPAGAAALADAIRESFMFERLILVAGVFADKDVGGIMSALAPESSFVIATETASGRVTPAGDVAGAASREGCDEVEVRTPVSNALERAIEIAGPDDLVLVAGSLYVVGEARSELVSG